ncbi:hypothetical protein [Telluria aromaticivorans]|uniref:Uncharacterized protein n=1 Tax=Telluria aromaticivorans TaxID=2725995 RepID=A0A7Y2K3A9_9BURK|nr:hypothetical protein [Telluria aromaticivorans]NNG25300.1 hypothetical protein [Telluria aromaticivorans]
MNQQSINEQALVDSLAASCTGQPARADVLVLQSFTQDDVRARATRFISLLREADGCSRDHASFTTRDDRTLVQLTGGARAVIYHASGALQFSAGVAPLEAPFARVEEREVLLRLVNDTAQGLKLAEWTGDKGSLAFERLWLSKAQGADRERSSEPVLLRATGAWRHAINGVPVLGAASVAITLAGDNVLDALSVRIRPGIAETLDSAIITPPEAGAQQIARNLASVLGNAKERLPSDAVRVRSMQFGYLDLGKRKAQRVLAPVYVAQVEVRHKLETQGYVFAVPATERAYQELPLFGTDQVAARSRASIGGHCKEVLR